MSHHVFFFVFVFLEKHIPVGTLFATPGALNERIFCFKRWSNPANSRDSNPCRVNSLLSFCISRINVRAEFLAPSGVFLFSLSHRTWKPNFLSFLWFFGPFVGTFLELFFGPLTLLFLVGRCLRPLQQLGLYKLNHFYRFAVEAQWWAWAIEQKKKLKRGKHWVRCKFQIEIIT